MSLACMVDEATKIKQHSQNSMSDSIDVFSKSFWTKSFIQIFMHGLSASEAYPWCLQYFKPD